jgi:WD40 repeat protein/serine/threonine protein kinase
MEELLSILHSGDPSERVDLAEPERRRKQTPGPLPRHIGNYQVVRVLGKGGMGTVYLAQQSGLNRPVALKVLKSSDKYEELVRFRQEASMAARLKHPNIVQIYEVGTAEEGDYLAMEYVEGGTLASQIGQGPLEPRDAATLVTQVVDAMAHAHAAGIIHRDLKPANILLSGEFNSANLGSSTAVEPHSSSNPSSGSRTTTSLPIPKIADFGLAKRIAASVKITQTGIAVGTPAYMSPEQARGMATVDHRTDVYSLGVILYECLTGSPPFRGPGPVVTLALVCGKEPVPLRQIQPRVPRDLETICLKCLEKDPGRRYPTATELGDDLRRFLAGKAVLARPINPIQRTLKWATRNPDNAFLLGMIFFVLVVGLVASLWQMNRANHFARDAGEKTELARHNLGLMETEKNRADGNAITARNEAEDAKKARDAAVRQSHIAKSAQHATLLALGQFAGANQDFAELERSLQVSPKEFRGSLEHGIIQGWVHRKGKVCTGFKGAVLCLHLSGDGKRIVTGDGDGKLKIWEAETGSEVLSVDAHPQSVVNSVRFNHNGTRIISGGTDNLVKIWDAMSGRLLRTVEEHNDPVNCVCFTRDGKRVVSGSNDNTIRIFDAESGEQKHILKGHTGLVTCVCLTPDDTRVISGSKDQTIRIWDAQSGEEKQILRGHASDVRSVCVNGDGSRAFSSDSHGFIRIWNLHTGKEIRSFKTHFGPIPSLLFHQRDQSIILCAEQVVRVWDTQTEQEKGTFKWPDISLSCVGISDDGSRIATCGKDLRIWNLRVSPETKSIQGNSHSVYHLAANAEGTVIAIGSEGGSIHIWDANRGRVRHHIQGQGDIRVMCLNADGTTLMTGNRAGNLKVWDCATGVERVIAQAEFDQVSCGCLSHDERKIITGGLDGIVRIWAVDGGEVTKKLSGKNGPVSRICVSRDGKTIVTANLNKLAVWDVESGNELFSLDADQVLVDSVCISKDGRRIFSGGFDRTIRVWEIETRQEIMALGRHTNAITSICLSEDGTRLISGSSDNTIRIWDVETGIEKLTLSEHRSGVRGVCLCRDGKQIISVSADHSIKIWDAATEPRPNGK